MKRLRCSVFFLTCAFLLLMSCSKETENAQDGGIYGVITDLQTGEPVANANVQLRPSGETTLTGIDGTYEYSDVEPGNYSITVSKAEYTDLIDDYVISVKSGKRMRRDVQIEKIPTYIRFTDMTGSNIHTLDFGSNPSLGLLSFNVYNNGTVKIDCQAIYQCEWISSVSPTRCSIMPGQNAMLVVQIDRSRLPAGENTTNLYVQSNNGSNTLVIRAVGGFSMPTIVTLPVTYVDGRHTAWDNTFHARIETVGNPAYTKKGFCFSNTNTEPTIDDRCVNVNGTGTGEFSYTYWDFPAQRMVWFVRPWVMWDGQVLYGDAVHFVYNDV